MRDIVRLSSQAATDQVYHRFALQIIWRILGQDLIGLNLVTQTRL